MPGAIDMFTKATGQNPDHLRSRLGLAQARVQKKDRVGDAENILKEVMQREAELSGPQKARATAIGAAILNIQEQYDQAIGLADKAIALNPEDPWAHHAKANALALKKDPGAAAAYDAVVAKAPSCPVFYFEGAANLQKAGQLDAGLALLAKYEAFFKNVKNPTADGKEEIYLDRDDRYWLARGDLLRNAGKQDDAMASYDKAIAAKSLSLTKAYYAKGSLLLEKKEFDKAAELLQDITPPDGTGQLPEAYMAMGEILFQKKEWGPACQNFAFALTRMKATQQPREKLNDVLTDVEKRLKAANQKEVAKLWVEEAKPLIQ
jgi:tetratricopeptide (TPR) repeat protein